MRLFHAVAVLLEVGHELLEILGREILSRNDHRRCVRRQPDWREVLGRVVFQIGVKCGGRHVRPHAGGKQRVAIVLRTRRTRGTDCTAGTTDVFDHDVLAERPAHSVSHDPRNHVARAAGRIRNDHRDRARRIILRGGGQTSHHQSGDAEQAVANCLHEFLHFAFTQRLVPPFALLVVPFA